MPITEEEINRINELYRKQKSEEGLTEEEKEEQKALRQKYVDAIRANLRSNLDSIKVKRPDGTIEPLKRKTDK
jgi:uncharacterized protein YnzC (UPF0291/DUF896 family)